MARSPLAIPFGVALVLAAAAPGAAQTVECLAPFDANCEARVPPGDHQLAVALHVTNESGPVSKARVTAHPDAGAVEKAYDATGTDGMADLVWLLSLRAGETAEMHVEIDDGAGATVRRTLSVRAWPPIPLETLNDGQHGYGDWKLDRPVGVVLTGVDESHCGAYHARFRADLSGDVSPEKAPARWDGERCVAVTTWRLGEEAGRQVVAIDVYDAPTAWRGSDPPTPYRRAHERVTAVARAAPSIDVGVAFTTLKKDGGADSETVVGVDLAPLWRGRGSGVTERLRFFVGSPADPDEVLDRVYGGLVLLPTLAFPSRENLSLKLIAGVQVRTTRGLDEDEPGVENAVGGWFLSGAFDLSGLASTVIRVLGI